MMTASRGQQGAARSLAGGAGSAAAALRSASERLSRARIENPWLDAEVLLRHALGLAPEDFVLKLHESLAEAARARFDELVRRRAAREPLAYITGEKEFWSLGFVVSPAVLVPRPETELLVELVLETTRRRGQAPTKILDIGTGSGAIAVTLAVHLPVAEVWASDVSPGALEIAEKNARRHGVESRMRFVQGDLFTPLANAAARFDVIVSNPPYVRRAELAALAPEIRQWEPAAALDGGAEGLDFYPDIIGGARNYLRNDGVIFLEVASDQAEAVAVMFARSGGYFPAAVHRDYAGHARVVTAKRGGAHG